MRKMIRKTVRRLWETLASVEMAAVLFVLIIAAALAGVFTSYDVYHASWFAGLLAAFGINLFACTAQRISAGKVRIGSLLSHLGILVILAGVIVSAMLSERGQISISEGETLNAYSTGRRVNRMPFGIRLDDFNLEWKNQTPHEIEIVVRDARVRQSLDVDVGGIYDIASSGYSIEVMRFVPDLFVDSGMNVVSRSDNPGNPALLVRISRGDKVEARWLFARYPDFTMERDGNIGLAYKFGKSPGDFKSTVTIFDEGKGRLTGTIEVNHPLKYRGYSFYQANYDPASLQWTGLEVVRDPGVHVVFAGILLLNLGVVIMLYRRSVKS